MKTVLTAALFSLLAFATARAQRYELGVMGLYPRFSRADLGSADTTAPEASDTKLTGRYGYGATITKNTKGYWGVELGYTRSRAKVSATVRPTDAAGNTLIGVRQQSVTVQQAWINVISYFMPAGERWRPFATGGIEASQYGAPHFAEWPGGGSRNYGANFGGGLKLKLGHLVVRWDIRDYLGGRPYHSVLQLAPGGHGHNLVGMMGFGIGF